MQRMAHTRLVETSGLMVWTTTEMLLKEHGPLAPIWLQGMPQRSQAAQLDGSLRKCSFDVIPTFDPNVNHTLEALARLTADRHT